MRRVTSERIGLWLAVALAALMVGIILLAAGCASTRDLADLRATIDNHASETAALRASLDRIWLRFDSSAKYPRRVDGWRRPTLRDDARGVLIEELGVVVVEDEP